MIDAKSNFMLLMCLLELTPAEMAKDLGTDVTLISRWRTGSRRLVPGRPWGPKVATYFVSRDAELEESMLRRVMSAMFPEKSTRTDAELTACTLQFLYCPGQMEHRYRQHRYIALKDALPGMLAPPIEQGPYLEYEGMWMHGMTKTQTAIMEYLNAFLKPGPPDRMIMVSPFGMTPILSIDDRFTVKFLERLQRVFALGHRMTMVTHPYYRPAGNDGLLERMEGMHLRGNLETKLCEQFRRNREFDDLLLLTSRDKLCVSVVMPGGEPTLSRSMVVQTTVMCAKTHLIALRLANLGGEDYTHGLYERPGGFFAGIKAQAAMLTGTYYYMSDVPLFGVLDIVGLGRLYGMTNAERAVIESQFEFLTLRPQDITEGRVRYVICRDEIERALITDDLPCAEMSLILGRETRLRRVDVLKLLRGLLEVMEQSDQLELAVLPRHIMSMVNMRTHIMEGVFAMGSAPDGHTTATKDPLRLSWCMRYADMVWRHIPSGMKRRSVNVKTLRGLVEQYQRKVRG